GGRLLAALSFRRLPHRPVPLLNDLDDSLGLRLVRNVEAGMFAERAALLLKTHDRNLGLAELLAAPVALLVEEHHRRPRTLGQHDSVQLLADENAVILEVVGELLERLGHATRTSWRGSSESSA